MLRPALAFPEHCLGAAVRLKSPVSHLSREGNSHAKQSHSRSCRFHIASTSLLGQRRRLILCAFSSAVAPQPHELAKNDGELWTTTPHRNSTILSRADNAAQLDH